MLEGFHSVHVRLPNISSLLSMARALIPRRIRISNDPGLTTARKLSCTLPVEPTSVRDQNRCYSLCAKSPDATPLDHATPNHLRCFQYKFGLRSVCSIGGLSELRVVLWEHFLESCARSAAQWSQYGQQVR